MDGYGLVWIYVDALKYIDCIGIGTKYLRKQK